MSKQNIAIIGLGKIGSAFLDAILSKKQNVSLVCVAEPMDTPGKTQAIAAGIKVATLDEIVAMGKEIDVIFDLSGNSSMFKELRHKLMASYNDHTIIASDTIAQLIWSLIKDA